MSNDYNGWRNYETWRVALEWFDDTESVLESFDERPTVNELADYLSGTIDEAIALAREEATWGILLDYAESFLSEVRYSEIAENMLEEWDEIKGYEASH